MRYLVITTFAPNSPMFFDSKEEAVQHFNLLQPKLVDPSYIKIYEIREFDPNTKQELPGMCQAF